MEIILKYKTIDGTEFSDKENALIHENLIYAEENKVLKNELKKKKNIINESSIKSYKESIINTIPETSGIYMLVNPEDDYKKYIGKTENLRNRYKQFLGNNPYAGSKIEKARKDVDPWKWNYNIMEICPIELLDEREAFYCDVFKTLQEGYNTMTPIKTTKINGKYNKAAKNAYKSYMSRAKSNLNNYAYLKNKTFDIKQEDFCEKYQKAQDTYNEILVVNDLILNLDDNINNYTVDNIVFIPNRIGIIFARRPKQQLKNGYYTGTTYNSETGKWKLNVERNFIDSFLEGKKNEFDTEEEAYKVYLDCKRKQIVKRTEEYRGKMEEHVYNILINLTIEQVEKLITY